MRRIAVCAALPVELKALCQRIGAPVPSAGTRWVRHRVDDSTELWLIASGVGHSHMKRVLASLPTEPVDLWLSFGLAGGLSPELKEGETVSGARMFFEQEMLVNATEDTNALLFCSHEALLTTEAKQNAHQTSGAVAVDMESGEVARAARERNEAFEWLRVISDAADETLNPALLRCIGRDGYPSISASIVVLMQNPWVLPELLAMGKKSEALSETLAEAAMKRLGLKN